MREMKPSSMEWVSDIPASWKVMPNKYLMYKKKEICPVYNGEDILSLTMKGVIVRDLDAGGKMPTSFDGYQRLEPGNLLMCLFDIDVTPRCIGLIKQTADRSLAMIDYALRRRFSFFDMDPGFDSEGFIKYQEGFANDTFNALIDRIKELNREIAKDKSLGKGFCIGHSYFCNTDECTDEWMQDVVDFDVLPMLAEYWFDDTDKLQRWENILHGVFQ